MKKLISLFLALCTALSLCIPVSAFDFHTSGDSYSIACNGSQVTVTASGSHQTGYLMVYLTNQSGKVAAQKIASAKKSISFSVKSLSDGIYYVEILTAKTQDGPFIGYATDKNTFPIEVYSGLAAETLSDIWVHNLSMMNKARTDVTARYFYRTASAQVQSSKTNIKTLAAQITAGKSTVYDKIKAVHDWVTENIAYDCDHAEGSMPNDALTVLQNLYTDAFGYANLTAALLRANGISAKVVSGYVQTDAGAALSPADIDSINHYWNEAYDSASKRWVILDTCWDSGNDYRKGKFIKGASYSRYFDPTAEAFSIDHYILTNEDYAGLKTYFEKQAAKVTIDYSRTVIYTGTVNHTANIAVTLPTVLKNNKVTFGSGDKTIAKVSSAGTVTAIGVGTVNITVKISDGYNSIKIKQAVKVKDPYLSFKTSVDTLKVGKSLTFAVSRYGVSGTVKWSVSDSTIASISSTGKLTGKKAGTVTVTAKIGDVKVSKKVKITK